MTDINIVFSRTLLAQLKPALERAVKRMFKDAWVWRVGRQSWEFHGPDGFYWHGRADNAYEARYKGWSAWLEKKGIAVDEVAS